MADDFWARSNPDAPNQPHDLYYLVRWDESFQKTKTNGNGTSGWAQALAVAGRQNYKTWFGIVPENGGLVRIHLCAHTPCTACWDAGKYGTMGVPMHLILATPPGEGAVVLPSAPPIAEPEVPVAPAVAEPEALPEPQAEENAVPELAAEPGPSEAPAAAPEAPGEPAVAELEASPELEEPSIMPLEYPFDAMHVDYEAPADAELPLVSAAPPAACPPPLLGTYSS